MDQSLASAICVFAESLVAHKRVVVIGDSSLALHELLSEMGARLVHVYDSDSNRALAQTPPEARGTVLRGMPDGDFEVRDGAFDLALVPDLAAMPDAAGLLARLRRVVGNDGAVLCAAANRDAEHGERGLDYYELFDLVSLQFASVRMIAAMPFVGMTLAELGQDEVDSAVRVDAQLAGERPPPSAFLALASQNDVALDAYTVIETGAATPVLHVAVAGDAVAVAELAQARLRADALAAQVQELGHARSALAAAEQETRRALETIDVERERAARLERDLDEQKRRGDVSDVAAELAHAQIRAAALEEGVELAEKTIVIQRERIADLEAELAAVPSLPPPAIADDTTELEADTLRLEDKLRERGERIAALEAELARREKLVKELVARLDHEPPDPALPAKLDELALLAAHQKSELEARAWRIAELERVVE